MLRQSGRALKVVAEYRWENRAGGEAMQVCRGDASSGKFRVTATSTNGNRVGSVENAFLRGGKDLETGRLNQGDQFYTVIPLRGFAIWH